MAGPNPTQSSTGQSSFIPLSPASEVPAGRPDCGATPGPQHLWEMGAEADLVGAKLLALPALQLPTGGPTVEWRVPNHKRDPGSSIPETQP